jgi:hypothetical protein
MMSSATAEIADISPGGKGVRVTGGFAPPPPGTSPEPLPVNELYRVILQDLIAPSPNQEQDSRTIEGFFVSDAEALTDPFRNRYSQVSLFGPATLKPTSQPVLVATRFPSLLVSPNFFVEDLRLAPRINVQFHAGLNPSPVVAEIENLRRGVEDEAIPTDFAYANAKQTVESGYGQFKSYALAPKTVPRPFVTTDDVGGIRLAWRSGKKQVLANFGARSGLKSYLYFESPIEHGSQVLDPGNLAGRLSWLTAR